MKRRVIAALLVVAMTASMLLGCGAGETKKEESTSEEKKDGYTIGLAMNTQTNPFFVTVKEGCQKAADEYGIELIVTDAQDDPAIQQKDIENLITKKPDAIIIDTCDSDAIVSSVEACNEAGIPVFTMDREASPAPHVNDRMSAFCSGRFFSEERCIIHSPLPGNLLYD